MHLKGVNDENNIVEFTNARYFGGGLQEASPLPFLVCSSGRRTSFSIELLCCIKRLLFRPDLLLASWQEQALKYGQEALPLIRTSHWHIGEALALTGLAEVYCAVGRHEDAAQCIRAELARIRRNTAVFESTLAQAFAIGREQGNANGFHTSSQMLRRLIPYGIELGIESSYCRRVIAKRQFAPPNSNRALCPWPVKIRAMGRLRIYLDDEAFVVKGKAQSKPLEILKVLRCSAIPRALRAASPSRSGQSSSMTLISTPFG